jgi:hypothetical protein
MIDMEIKQGTRISIVYDGISSEAKNIITG